MCSLLVSLVLSELLLSLAKLPAGGCWCCAGGDDEQVHSYRYVIMLLVCFWFLWCRQNWYRLLQSCQLANVGAVLVAMMSRHTLTCVSNLHMLMIHMLPCLSKPPVGNWSTGKQRHLEMEFEHNVSTATR
jgi:hypothetical protein